MTAAKPTNTITQFENIKLSSPIITNNTIRSGSGATPATITIPTVDATLATTTTEQTFTHKTLTAPTMSGTVLTDSELKTGTGGAATITLPTVDATLATTTTEQTLTNKHFDETSTAVVKSSGPTAWTKVSPPTGEAYIARIGGRLAYGSTTGPQYLDDGEWKSSTLYNADKSQTITDQHPQRIIATDTEFVVYGESSYFTSTDGGATYVASAFISGAAISEMRYLNGKLYVWGTLSSAQKIWYLDSGSWVDLSTTVSTFAPASHIYSVAGADGHLLVECESQAYFVSGTTVTPLSYPSGYQGHTGEGEEIRAHWLGEKYILELSKNVDQGKLYTYTPGATTISDEVVMPADEAGTYLLSAGNGCILCLSNKTVGTTTVRRLLYTMDLGQHWIDTGCIVFGATEMIYTNNHFDVVARTSTDAEDEYSIYHSNMAGKISIKFSDMADFFLSSGGGDNNTKYIIQLMRYIAYKFSGSGLDLSDIFEYVDPDDELDAALPASTGS